MRAARCELSEIAIEYTVTEFADIASNQVPRYCQYVFTDPARLFHGAEECARATVQMGMCGLEGFDTFCHAPVWVGGELDLNGIEHAVTFQEDVDLGPAGGAPVVKCWVGG